MKGNWDILVLHDPETVLAGLAGRLFYRKPVIFDVHENVPAIAMTRPWVPDGLRRPLSIVSAWLLRFSEMFLSITLAEPGYQTLFRNPHPVFPNYPDTTHYPHPIPTGNGEVIYVGDITLERGADVAVEACGIAGVPLRLVGNVDTETRADLEASPRPSVRFEGAVPNPTAVRLIAGSSVGVSPLRDIPNYRNSLPTKILEYLGVGVPVVASDLPGTRAIVGELEGVILVSPADPEELAAALTDAMTPEMREAAAAQAHVIRDRFRWPAQEVRDFYVGLL
jgi:glycosyltransferase involved in cell wall biosynthesis